VKETGYSDRTRIVEVKIVSKSGILRVGIVVDSVSEAVNIKSTDIGDSPIFLTAITTEYMTGTAKMAGRIRIL
jgi:purine-binding chemotaxis protein CheW